MVFCSLITRFAIGLPWPDTAARMVDMRPRWSPWRMGTAVKSQAALWCSHQDKRRPQRMH